MHWKEKKVMKRIPHSVIPFLKRLEAHYRAYSVRLFPVLAKMCLASCHLIIFL